MCSLILKVAERCSGVKSIAFCQRHLWDELKKRVFVKSRVSREVHARSEASELIEVSGEIPLAYSTTCWLF
jgi:hypothetical protein